MKRAQVWIFLSIALAMLSPDDVLAANKAMEAILGAWGKVDDDPNASGCRLYANRTDGDYFVLGKDYVETGGECVCILEGSHPSDNCFEINLFCRCDDGITVKRRYQRLCPDGGTARLEVIEDGTTSAYERCKTRR